METIVLNIGLIVFITIAIVNRIKAEVKPLAPYWYTLIAIAIGAGLYAVALYAPPVVTGFVCVGGAAAGIFDVYAKKGI